MSVEAMAWAFQVPLKPCPKSVLVALANRADEDGYCWPGIGDLQLRTGWGVRSIQTALHELEGAGLLRISPRFLATGTQTSNLYQLVLTPISCGEGAGGAGGRVQVVRGEGAGGAPKSSSEQSSEQSREQDPPTPRVGGMVCVVGSAEDQEFDQFWEEFPNKVGKKAARRAWKKAKDRPALVIILQAIDQAKKSERWQRGIIPNPATWLNQGRWADVMPLPIQPKPVGLKAYQPVPSVIMHGEACPPEVAAKLARLLGRDATFS